MCLSWYLYSHYDMCFGAMRKVCLPAAQGKKSKAFVKTWWDTELKWQGRGAYVLCQVPRFTILPLHVIKKEHQQETPFFTPSFIPLPLFLISFSIFFPFYIEKPLASPPSAALLLFCAEGRWQKELCKRAFKIPKWLWSAHNGPKNAALDKGWPLPHHSALQWWIRTDAWTWAGFGATEAPPRPPLGLPKGTGLGDTLEPQPRGLKTITSC